MSKQFGFFNVLNHILYGSPISEENLNDFSLYMFNRWLSMRSVQDCKFVNDFLNNKQFSQLNTDKVSLVTILKNLSPKRRMCKINYIKNEEKTKVTKLSADDEKILEILSKALEISQREVKLYFERDNLKTSQEYKQIKKSLL